MHDQTTRLQPFNVRHKPWYIKRAKFFSLYNRKRRRKVFLFQHGATRIIMQSTYFLSLLSNRKLNKKIQNSWNDEFFFKRKKERLIRHTHTERKESGFLFYYYLHLFFFFFFFLCCCCLAMCCTLRQAISHILRHTVSWERDCRSWWASARGERDGCWKRRIGNYRAWQAIKPTRRREQEARVNFIISIFLFFSKL
jgi:hypothetical protein